MKNEIFSSILEERITVIASRPLCGRLNLLLSILEEFGIHQNKTMYMCNFEESEIWYTINLISLLSNIKKEEIHKIFHPCNSFHKEKVNLDADKLKNTIDKLLESQIHINTFSNNIEKHTDILDVIFEILDSFLCVWDFIIINTIEQLAKKSRYNINEILLKLYQYAKYQGKHIIIVADIKRSGEEKIKYDFEDIVHFKNLKTYVKNFILSNRPKAEECRLEITMENANGKNNYSCQFDFDTNKLELENEKSEKR